MSVYVHAYRPQDRNDWDEFVRRSRNGTFLLLRGYMDYHADRFADFSLMVRDGKGRVLSCLPANREAECLTSHGGLTYGGFILDARMNAVAMLEVFDVCREHLASCGIREWIYKPVPHIYHVQPAEEDLYALFRCDAALIRRDVGACACPSQLGEWPERVAASLRKAASVGSSVAESHAFRDFWPILEQNLGSRHGARPVHSLSEMERLNSLFPHEIRLFVVSCAGKLHAGAVVYETSAVAHVQYAAVTEEGRINGASALLITDLLRTHFRDKKWFDYGISTTECGRVLNSGLQRFKEGFGLRSVVADHYSIPLS